MVVDVTTLSLEKHFSEKKKDPLRLVFVSLTRGYDDRSDSTGHAMHTLSHSLCYVHVLGF